MSSDDATKTETKGGEEGTLLGMLIGLSVLSAALLVRQSATPGAITFAGITVDRLGAALTLLVAAIGAVTFRFSMRYMDGDPGRRRFLRLLALAIGSAYLLMLATDLRLLIAAWSLTSFALHRLLIFYPDRVEAWRPARKKFLISRLGDVALISGATLVWWVWGTFDLHTFLRGVADGGGGPAETAVGLLVVIAALTKSAQFPFHSWLPETMESPTPVSALMHAGIINAGGVLLLRFAPLIVRVPEALFLLALVGSVTACLGTLAMWAQVKVKRTLAWSTVGQMGFMMVQCGLGAFPVAALHIVGHGCYKAWSFLRSGDLPPSWSPPAVTSPGRTLAMAAIGTGACIPALWLASRLTGFAPWHSPGEWSLSAVVALSLGQVWVALFRASTAHVGDRAARVAVALLTTLAASVAIAALYRGAALFLEPVLGDLPAPTGPIAWASATLPVLALAALCVIHATLPTFGRTSAGRAFRVHALHGFYFGAVADRLVDRLWPRALPSEVKHA